MLELCEGGDLFETVECRVLQLQREFYLQRAVLVRRIDQAIAKLSGNCVGNDESQNTKSLMLADRQLSSVSPGSWGRDMYKASTSRQSSGATKHDEEDGDSSNTTTDQVNTVSPIQAAVDELCKLKKEIPWDAGDPTGGLSRLFGSACGKAHLVRGGIFTRENIAHRDLKPENVLLNRRPFRLLRNSCGTAK